MQKNAKQRPKSVLLMLVNGPIGVLELVLRLVVPDWLPGHEPVPSLANALAHQKKLSLVMKPSVHQKLIHGSRGDNGRSALNPVVSVDVNVGQECVTATAAKLRDQQTFKSGGVEKISNAPVPVVVNKASGLTGRIGQPVKVAVPAAERNASEIALSVGANVLGNLKKRFRANQITAS